jgi:hypothetical protein
MIIRTFEKALNTILSHLPKNLRKGISRDLQPNHSLQISTARLKLGLNLRKNKKSNNLSKMPETSSTDPLVWIDCEVLQMNTAGTV